MWPELPKNVNEKENIIIRDFSPPFDYRGSREQEMEENHDKIARI